MALDLACLHVIMPLQMIAEAHCCKFVALPLPKLRA